MTVVLATCHEQSAITPSDALLWAALDAHGAEVRAVPWDQIPTNLPDDTRVCLRETWDYHRRPTEFRTWVQAFVDSPDRLWNPPATVLWNMDKIYLRELETAGVRLPFTYWFDPGQRPDVRAFFHATGQDQAVLKPRVSATVYGTHLLESNDEPNDAEWPLLEREGCLLQAFVPDVRTAGELSLVYLDGCYSHAVCNRATAGEFRVQMDFGGTSEAVQPSAHVRAFCESVLAAAARPWLYARVDVVDTASGPLLMELELIEPELFLTHGAARVLAAALSGDPRVARGAPLLEG